MSVPAPIHVWMFLTGLSPIHMSIAQECMNLTEYCPGEVGVGNREIGLSHTVYVYEILNV